MVVSCSCDGKCLICDSFLSEITVKLLTGGRGHCSVVSDDGKILQKARKMYRKKKSSSLLSRLSLRWWAGIYSEMSTWHASCYILPEGKERLG